MKHKVLLAGLSLYCVFNACLGLPTPDGSAAYRGKLVDGVTGKPVAGAVVMATWHSFTADTSGPILHQGGGSHYSCYQLVNVVSTVSGPDGGFELPGWLGKPAGCAHMSLQQPFLLYYKPGYALITSPELPNGYIPGAPFTATGSDVGTLSLHPLGGHYFTNMDNHVRNLSEFARLAHESLDQSGDGPCFWKEASPLLLMYLQEARRLSAYAEGGTAPPYLDGSIMGGHCADPAALDALMRQAQATVPEQPALPYVRPAQRRDWQHAPAAPSAEPDVLQTYAREGLAPGHAGEAKSIVYHVDLNPANPYYLAMLRVGAPMDDAADGEKLSLDGIYGYTCPGYGDTAPTQVAVQYQRGSSGAVMLSGGAPGARSVAKEGVQPRTVSDERCTWTAALIPTDLIADMSSVNLAGRRDIYSEESGTWTLTQRSLVRPGGTAAPELLELHGPPGLMVTTTLASAGPNRWRLPPPGQPFTLTMATAVKDPDDACRHLLPDTLRLRIAGEFGAFRLLRLSDAPGGDAACHDVVSGDFDGTGATSYAFHLAGYGMVQRLVVASPRDADWHLTVIQPHGCYALKDCTLQPLAAGKYRRSTRQWLDPDGPHQYPVDYAGQPSSLEAPHPGFIEDWKEPISYAYFFMDGEWVSLSVDGSVRSLEFPRL